MLTHPNIDPIAFSIGPLSVRWYGLMYLAGFAAGWWLGLRRIGRGDAPVTRRQFDVLLFLAVLGVILGGRLGYVLFYKPGYYAAHPAEIDHEPVVQEPVPGHAVPAAPYRDPEILGPRDVHGGEDVLDRFDERDCRRPAVQHSVE